MSTHPFSIKNMNVSFSMSRCSTCATRVACLVSLFDTGIEHSCSICSTKWFHKVQRHFHIRKNPIPIPFPSQIIKTKFCFNPETVHEYDISTTRHSTDTHSPEFPSTPITTPPPDLQKSSTRSQTDYEHRQRLTRRIFWTSHHRKPINRGTIVSPAARRGPPDKKSTIRP